MSDQYTRIRWGGSPLDTSAPVVGLLFGKQRQDEDGARSLYVEDAGDIPLQDAQKQIDLHRAVFPTHGVLGWYKVVVVGEDNEPTVEDLQQTQKIQTLYQKSQEQDKEKGSASEITTETSTSSKSTTNDAGVTFFGLLQVPSMKKQTPSVTPSDGEDSAMKIDEEKAGTSQNKNDDAEEDELPLTLFRLEESNGSASLVAVRTWSLHTSDSERFAVQRVMREKTSETMHSTPIIPPASQKQQSGGEEATSKPPPFQPSSQPPPQPSSISLATVKPQAIRPYTDELQESCMAISTRLTLIMQYLETLESDQSSLSVNDMCLLRQIQGLLRQLSVISGTTPHPSPDSCARQLHQLASLAQTVDAVTMYTEKLRFLHEHGGGGAGGGPRGGPREVRRF